MLKTDRILFEGPVHQIIFCANVAFAVLPLSLFVFAETGVH